MTYMEVFNLVPSGLEPDDSLVELAAKWVQWAGYALNQGASQNDATIRYNLDQFWKSKASSYYMVSAAGQRKLDVLDTWAHGYWAALESGKQISSPASVLSVIGSAITGGAPSRPGAEQATVNLQQAAAGMAAAGQAAGTPGSVALANLGTQWGAAAVAEKAQADDIWKRMTAVGPFGIPLIVWAAGGAVLLGVLFMGSRE